MPILLGVVLGVFLTVAGANWHGLRANLRELGADLERGWKKISG